MSLTLAELVDSIDDCLEDSKQIGIIANKDLAEFIEIYLAEYEMIEKYNVLQEPVPFNHKNDEYLIMINCKDDCYSYYIFYYKLNERLLINFDELYICSTKVNSYFDHTTMTSKLFMFSDDMELDNDEMDYLLYGHDEVCEDSCECDCEEDMVGDCIPHDNRCVPCCVECEETDCEYQGNIDDCDCDDCYEYKEYVKNDMDNMDHMDTESDEHSVLDREDYEEYVRETLPTDMDDRTKDLTVQLFYYAEMVKNACSHKCLLKILASLHEEVSEQAWHDGWNGCKEYVKESLDQ